MPDALLENLPAVPYQGTADDFHFLFVGPQAESLLGFPVAEWYKPGFWKSRLHPEQRDQVVQWRVEDIQGHSDLDHKYPMIAADGQVVWIQDIARVITINGAPPQCCGLLLDITAQKHNQAAKDEQLEQRFQASNLESLGVLAGGIAHAFNNLLTGVIGYTELATRELPPGSMALAFLEEVARAGRRGAQITSQLLLLAGKGRFTFQTVSLSSLIQEMSRELLGLIPRQATLRFECAGNCPNIDADPEQVRQLILELVTNSAEAMREAPGSITVRTGVRQVDQPGDYPPFFDPEIPAGQYVWLVVVDTGTGMNKATLERIFEPFFSTRFAGRGLGLSAVVGIVTAHRGLMRVTSTRGKGTSFEVLFPVAKQANKENERPDNQEEPVSS